MPFDFTEGLAAIAPRALFVNAPDSDSNFEVSGVTDRVATARPVYEKSSKPATSSWRSTAMGTRLFARGA